MQILYLYTFIYKTSEQCFLYVLIWLIFMPYTRIFHMYESDLIYDGRKQGSPDLQAAARPSHASRWNHG